MTDVYSGALIIFLINAISAVPTNRQNSLESHLLLLLERWRIGQVDSDVLPLPSLKSIKIQHVEHTYDRQGIKMTYVINEMELTGLDSFSVENLKAADAGKNLEIAITINIPKLTLYADKYEIKGRAYYVYPLKGSGNMTVILRDNDLMFKIRFGTAEDGISTIIEDILLDFNVDEIEANLVDSSWPINKVLNSDGVEILESYHDDIVQALWDNVVPYVNAHLLNVTTKQLITTISYFSINKMPLMWN